MTRNEAAADLNSHYQERHFGCAIRSQHPEQVFVGRYLDLPSKGERIRATPRDLSALVLGDLAVTYEPNEAALQAASAYSRTAATLRRVSPVSQTILWLAFENHPHASLSVRRALTVPIALTPGDLLRVPLDHLAQMTPALGCTASEPVADRVTRLEDIIRRSLEGTGAIRTAAQHRLRRILTEARTMLDVALDEYCAVADAATTVAEVAA